MTGRGVVFHQKPAAMEPITLAVFEDSCGNLIQLLQDVSTLNKIKANLRREAAQAK